MLVMELGVDDKDLFGYIRVRDVIFIRMAAFFATNEREDTLVVNHYYLYLYAIRDREFESNSWFEALDVLVLAYYIYKFDLDQ